MRAENRAFVGAILRTPGKAKSLSCKFRLCLNDGSLAVSKAIRAPHCHDNKRARVPCDFRMDTAFESKETNSSAPSQSPS